jgi:hypothetical protein
MMSPIRRIQRRKRGKVPVGVYDGLTEKMDDSAPFRDNDEMLVEPCILLLSTSQSEEERKRPVKAVCFFSEVWGILGP